MNGCIYKTKLLSAFELYENAQGASATKFWLREIEVAGRKVLVFYDNGHGVKGDLEEVVDMGYDNGELTQQREQNRLFHRGLVIAMDSLSADSHLFSLARDEAAGANILQVARYGPALVAQMEQSSGKKVSMDTLGVSFVDAAGEPMQHGVSASTRARELLVNGSVFSSCDEVRDHVKALLASREGVEAGAPGFGAVIVLKPQLQITSSQDDLRQGGVSLREKTAQRYLPAGTGLTGVTAPTCELVLQGAPVALRGLDADAFTKVLKYTCPKLGYDMVMRLSYKAKAGTTSGASPARTRYAPPTLHAVVAGSNILAEVKSEYPNVERKAFEQLANASWSRRSSDDSLSGYERNCWPQICALSAGKEQVNNADSVKVAFAADGTHLLSHMRTVMTKRDFSLCNKEFRGLMCGEGVSALVVLTPREDATDVALAPLTSDKMELTHEGLVATTRKMLHQALVHCAEEAYAALYPGVSMLWKAILEEREAEAEAQRQAELAAAAAAEEAATQRQRAAEEEAAAAEKAALQAALRAAQQERNAKRKRNDAGKAKLAAQHQRRNAQRMLAAANSRRAGLGNQSQHGEEEDDDDDDAGAAGGDVDMDEDDAAAAAAACARPSSATRSRAGAASTSTKPCCPYCRTALSAHAAARANKLLTEDFDARMAAKDARIEELELQLRRHLGRE